jgi:nitrate reductase delta subunit
MEARLFHHLVRRFQRLLSYPRPGYAAAASALQRALTLRFPEAAAQLADFVKFAESSSVEELEEEFTRTFELNPACALEVGWHLFGEEYARGLFLVRMREELRRHGLAEDRELPDHLTHVLALLAAMRPETAAPFVCACVWPALGRMQRSLAKSGSPYATLFAALRIGLQQAFELHDLQDERDAAAANPAAELDVTVRDAAEWDDELPVATGCGGDDIEIVPLDMDFTTQTATVAHNPAELLA